MMPTTRYYIALGLAEGVLMFLFLAVFYFAYVQHKERESTTDQVNNLVDRIIAPVHVEIFTHTSMNEMNEKIIEENQRVFSQVSWTLLALLLMLPIVLLWMGVKVGAVMRTSLLTILIVAVVEFFFMTSVALQYQTVRPQSIREQLVQLLSQWSV